MEEDRIWKLIARKLGGEATGEEAKELEDLLRANPELHFTIETFYKLWNSIPVKQTEEDNANKLLERIRKQSSHHELYSKQRKIRHQFLKRNFMFRNNFKIAWRNLIKDRQFTFLNLIGLSTGLACALLIFLWINDERSVDRFHEKDDRLYQVMQNNPEGDGSLETDVHTPGLLAESLKDEMPEVEEAAVVATPFDETKGILSVGDKSIKATELYVSRNFFDVFSYQITEGNKDQLLDGKYNVLLSEETALKLFQTTDNIIGKTIDWDRGTDYVGKVSGSYVVSGIFKKPPLNSTAQFDLLFTYELFFEKYKENLQQWTNSNPSTYIVLKKGTDIDRFNAKIRDFRKEKVKALNGNVDWLKWIGTFFIQRYSDRYLYNKYENGIQSGGRIQYIKLFSIIAVFILVIACINFMNLTTAKASRRMKEVGIKKVAGASRRTLIFQYLGESMLMSFLSLAIAVLLVILFLPAFNAITGKHIVLSLSSTIVISALSIAVFTGVISGSYPAFYLSGFNPAAVLKGKLKTPIGDLWIRKGLVVFQFVLSVIFIISVLVIYQQTKYIHSKNLGYNRDNIIRFNKDGRLREGTQTFLTEIKKIPGVINASNMGGDMTGNHGGTSGLDWPEKKTGMGVEFEALWVDYDMMETLGLQMAEGRMFSREFGSDSSNLIFNEAAIAAMGLKNPVGKIINLWGKEHRIIGVVKNFHFESLYERMKPFFFKYSPGGENILVKIKSGSEKETLARVETLYKQFNPGLPFDYKFIDEDYQQLYASEQRIAVLSRYFAGIAIIISCLGLFGLAAFTAQKRQKEIGIRKVVGASVSNIAAMLSKDFLKLILIAVVIAFPLSWWAMNEWLKNFAYRIDIGAGVFLIAGASIILITLLTIGFQAIKAAIANPVKSLRTE